MVDISIKEVAGEIAPSPNGRRLTAYSLITLPDFRSPSKATKSNLDLVFQTKPLTTFFRMEILR